jgi:hypothetical protein
MILDPDDCERFFKLHKALTLFVNQRLQVVEPPARSAKEIVALIDAFVEENPFKLDADELGIGI